MKCKHEWLFVKTVERRSKKYEEENANYEVSDFVEEKKGFIDKLFFDYLSSDELEKRHNRYQEAFKSLWLRQFMETGRKYACANCDEIKEVF